MADIEVKGATFDTAPATSQIYYKTDAFGSGSGAWCEYDGANWVTSQLFSFSITEATYTTDDAIIQETWIGDAYQPVGVRFECRTFVATTNDTDNYWNVSVRGRNLAQTANTAISTISTIDDAADVRVDHGEAADTPKPTNYGALYFAAVATGTPGNLTFDATLTYRLVIA